MSFEELAVKYRMTNSGSDNSQEATPSAERASRARKLIRVEIERENTPVFSALVTNLSAHGMGGRTDGELQPFDLITIIKKGYGRISGEVRWIDGKNFGVYFSEPVNVDLFNFTDDNKQQHFVQQAKDGRVWNGFDRATSTRRPGLTDRFSKS
ncbi:hypothetical protein [Parasphingorhabdus sp.]|uniref:hypothetical protein n=1 Tax=Parasphingorhabdus sp. TaxID=2709688 RepID=UPI003A8ECD9D